MDGLRPDFLPDRSLIEDERAIEGLPIRLVIALVVGIAALAIMMGLLNGLPQLQDNDMSVEYNESIVDDDGAITVTVIGSNGEPVSEADVLLQSGNAQLDQPYYGTTGSDGNVTFDLGSGGDQVTVDWRSNQESGTVKAKIKEPGDSDFSDVSANTELTVVRT